MHNTAPSRTVLTLGLIGGILAVSAASIFITFAQEWVPSIVIAAWRLAVASLVLAPLAVTRNRGELTSLSRRELWPAVLSGLFLALHFASWISSLQFTSVASSVVLVTTTPLWVALLSPLILLEPIRRTVGIGMMIALAGGVLVAISDSCAWQDRLVCSGLDEVLGARATLGNFLALFGAWMAAGYILIGRRLRARMTLIPYVFLVYGMAALVLIVIMLLSGQAAFGYPPQAYFWMILLALVPQLLGHSAFNWALAYLPASFVSVALFGEPIGSIILAYFVLGQQPGAINLLGCALILAGIFIATREPPVQSS
jgi:drug/metabolite transporter (DMT)-like permease